ncbi:MAG: flagella basal body P-ring formation protein FlgA [Hydrogenophilaceae bacterium CG1_02_62_390]|nr:flagellar basal body P-ring formation protein FlgA [Betaproteobacteria bacterium]OIO78475.1 MAG: flagella basal body P-ring formation protein FlgA [Hydrogenophilaceae bacterium CG1_02_62_390]
MRCPLFYLALLAVAYPMLSLAEVIRGPEALRAAASRFIGGQIATTYPDSRAEIEIGSVAEHAFTPVCLATSFSLAAGSRLWGAGNLAVQCDAPSPWSLYLTYRVRLIGPALTARRPLPSRYSPTAQDLVKAEIEYTIDPGRYPRDPANLHGAVLTMPLAKGRPITIDQLQVKAIIQAGQRVRIRSDGPGFQISQEGVAQRQAGVGELLRLKLGSGRIVQGIVRDDGTVYIGP